jgi:hypothetical protein
MQHPMQSKSESETVQPLQSTPDLAERLREAMQHPGVAELFEVYESWRRYDEVYQAHQKVAESQFVFSTSDSSGPLVSRTSSNHDDGG